MKKIIRYVFIKINIVISTILFKVKLYIYNQPLPSKLKIDGWVYLKISKQAKLLLGKNFTLNSRKASNLVGISNIASFQIIENGRIEIGNDCGFTSTTLSSRSLIRIGNYVKIGGNVRIFDHDYHSLNYLIRRDPIIDGSDVKTAPVIIEDDVFIGTNTIILKGVHIGARTIIGAGSVVMLKSVPPDSIIAGNPAVIISTSNT